MRSPLFPLGELVEALARLEPARALRRRADVEALTSRVGQARQQLAQATSALASVLPDGTAGAWTEWSQRATAVADARRVLRLLGVEVDVQREQLECDLFLARQGAARRGP